MHAANDRTIEQLQAHAGFARGLARGLLRDDHAADDVVQDAFVAALEQPPKRNPRAWLATVTRRLSLNRLRSRRRRDAREETVAAARPQGALPPELAARRDAVRSVMDAVLGLPEAYQEVVLLRFYEDLTPTRIAERLGVPAPTIRTRLRRALALLREQLDEDHDGARERWRLALLPVAGLVPPPPGGTGGGMSTNAATTAAVVGGALMGKKIIVAAVAALLLVLGGSAIVVGLPDAPESTSESALQARDAQQPGRRVREGKSPADPVPPESGDESDAGAEAVETAAQKRLVEPGEARLIGRVIDEKTGEGVPDAAVFLQHTRFARPEFEAARPFTQTDATGRFVCADLAPGSYHVAARAPDRLDAHRHRVKTTLESPASIELTVRVPQTIRGRISAPDGRSLEGARVYAETPTDRREHGLWWGHVSEHGEIAADGTFEIHGLPGEDHDVYGSLQGRGTLLARRVHAVPAGGPAIEVRLEDRLGPKTTMSVRFLAPDGGNVASVTFRETTVTWGGGGGRGTDGVKGAVLSFAYRDSIHCVWIEPLSYVDVDGTEHAVAPVPTRLGKAYGTEKVVTMEPPVTLAGRVVDPDGAGIGGVEIRAGHAHPDLSGFPEETRIETAADGSFRIEGLAAADHSLWVLAPPAFLDRRDVIARPGTGAVITLRRALQPVVTVLDAGGQPVEDVDVELWVFEDGEFDVEYDAETDAEGVARLESVEPGRTYRLVLDPPDERHARHAIPDWTPADVSIRLPAGRSVGGVVVDRAGKPIPDATVELRIDGSEVERDTYTKADGSFRFDGLSAGAVTLFVCLTGEEPDDQTPRFEATIGDVALELAVDPGLVLRGTVSNWGSRALSMSRGVRFIEDGPEPRRVYTGEHEDGRFWFAGLPEGSTGTVFIGILPGGFHAIARGVRTDAGELTLRLVRGAKIEGRIVYPDGVSPYAGYLIVSPQMFGVGLGGHQVKGERFELTGLPDGPCTVRARLRLGDDEYEARALAEPGVAVELVLR